MLCQTNTFSFSQIDASGSQRLVKSLGAAAVQSKPCGQCTAVHWPLAHSRHSWGTAASCPRENVTYWDLRVDFWWFMMVLSCFMVFSGDFPGQFSGVCSNMRSNISPLHGHEIMGTLRGSAWCVARFFGKKNHGSLVMSPLNITQPLGINGLLDGYYFRWCPIFPKWDSYQPLKTDLCFWACCTMFTHVGTGWAIPALSAGVCGVHNSAKLRVRSKQPTNKGTRATIQNNDIPQLFSRRIKG